jgi:Ca2+-binding EF-hand superfamily protein
MFANFFPIEIKGAFDLYDADHSESINSSEIKQLLHKLGLDSNQKEVDEMMQELDRNKDGKVTFPEFAKVVGGRFYVERSHSEIAELLRSVDKDGSGNLSRDEVFEAMKKARGNLSHDEVVLLFNQADKDHTGKIDINGKKQLQI